MQNLCQIGACIQLDPGGVLRGGPGPPFLQESAGFKEVRAGGGRVSGGWGDSGVHRLEIPQR